MTDRPFKAYLYMFCSTLLQLIITHYYVVLKWRCILFQIIETSHAGQSKVFSMRAWACACVFMCVCLHKARYLLHVINMINCWLINDRKMQSSWPPVVAGARHARVHVCVRYLHSIDLWPFNGARCECACQTGEMHHTRHKHTHTHHTSRLCEDVLVSPRPPWRIISMWSAGGLGTGAARWQVRAVHLCPNA